MKKRDPNHPNAKHGMEGTRTYRIWRGIKARCDWPKMHNYAYYGGRGISYDPRWKDFRAFFADMGEAPEGMQIDRIDNDAGYFKANCRWVTPEQNSNNRRSSRLYGFRGQTLSSSQIARAIGMNVNTLDARLRDGWTIEEAVATPTNRKGKRPWRATAAMAAIILSACSVLQTAPPEERTRTVEVKIPIITPCFTEDERPVPAPLTPIDIDNATTDQLAAAMAADDANEALFVRAVEALFLRCAAAAGKPVPEAQPPKEQAK